MVKGQVHYPLTSPNVHVTQKLAEYIKYIKMLFNGRIFVL